jgi:hypothetical protein
MPATIADLTTREVEQRLDYLIGQFRSISDHADRDLRERLLQYVFGAPWAELGPDDDRWTAAEFVIAGHMYGRSPAVGMMQRELVELINGIEDGIATVDGESHLRNAPDEIKRRAERLAATVTGWVDTLDFGTKGEV